MARKKKLGVRDLVNDDFTPESLKHVYSTEVNNPFKCEYVEQEVLKIFNLSTKFPTYFNIKEASKLCSSYIEMKRSEQIDSSLWDMSGLRQKVLNYLSDTCDSCTKCELYKNSPKNRESLPYKAVFGEGNVDSSLMIVAEGPGEYESRTSLPLAGKTELKSSYCGRLCDNYESCFLENHLYLPSPSRACEYKELDSFNDNYLARLRSRYSKIDNSLYTAGELLDTCLAKAGIQRNSVKHLQKMMVLSYGKDKIPDLRTGIDVYITNAVRHRCLFEGRNASPLDYQIAACNPYLEMTIDLVRPKVILALGNTSLKALGCLVSVSKACPIDNSVEPQIVSGDLHSKILVCFHPAYIMHNSKNKEEEALMIGKMQQVIDKAADICR